jgi:hypothetical protein
MAPDGMVTPQDGMARRHGDGTGGRRRASGILGVHAAALAPCAVTLTVLTIRERPGALARAAVRAAGA